MNVSCFCAENQEKLDTLNHGDDDDDDADDDDDDDDYEFMMMISLPGVLKMGAYKKASGNEKVFIVGVSLHPSLPPSLPPDNLTF